MNIELLLLEDPILFNWYEKLIEQSISCIEGKKLQNGKVEYYKQELFKQFFTHFVSIKHLSNGIGIVLKGKPNEISALPSIAVIVRACLENYSMFFYIYRHSNSSDEKEFKFWSWYREGLISRQRLQISHQKEKQVAEKKLLEDITNRMKANPFYNKLTDNQQNQYLKHGKWCFVAKRDLLRLSGFSEPLASNCYNFFSSYAHPSSGSHLQTAQASYEDALEIQKAMLKALFISAGLYVKNYSNEFPEVIKGINEEDRELIETWCWLGHELLK